MPPGSAAHLAGPFKLHHVLPRHARRGRATAVRCMPCALQRFGRFRAAQRLTGTRHALLLGLQQDMTEGSAPRLQHCGQVCDELALITNAYVAEVVRGRQLIEARVGHAPLRVSAAGVAIQQKNLDRKFVVIDKLQLLL